MRYFFAPMPAEGHVNPGLSIAQALVKRGHDVRWYSIPRFKEAIESAGARYIPLGAMPDMLRDCEEELRREPADVLIGDNVSAIVETLHAKLDIPWAVYGVTVLSNVEFLLTTSSYGNGQITSEQIRNGVRHVLV